MCDGGCGISGRGICDVKEPEKVFLYVRQTEHSVVTNDIKHRIVPEYIRDMSLPAEGKGISSTWTCCACLTASK